MSTKVTLVIGGPKTGKSTYIQSLIKQFNADPAYTYEPTLSSKKGNHNEEIAVFEKGGEHIILNSGSDTKPLIKAFSTALTGCSNIAEIYTAIRYPKNTRLHLWMKRAVGLSNKVSPHHTQPHNPQFPHLTIEEYII